MLGLGLASSHAPALFEPADRWSVVYNRIPSYMKESQPHTAKLETIEVIEGYLKRTNHAFNELREALAAYRPDALIMIGDDQGDMFDRSINPSLYLYTGDSLWGLDKTSYWPLEERKRVEFPCHSELSKFVLKRLVQEGFDMASGSEFNHLGIQDHGVSHMIA